MSELDEVRVFVTLVECHSASKAAERLGVANSAISRRMKALEERLDVRRQLRDDRLGDNPRHCGGKARRSRDSRYCCRVF